MTAAALPFPNSQILAGWWGKLSERNSPALWVGAIRLHRVEVLAETTLERPVDPLARLVLTALHVEAASIADLDGSPTSARDRSFVLVTQLHPTLGLDRPLLVSVLAGLQRQGLVLRAEDQATAAWAVTPLGRKALDLGHAGQALSERRAFHFLESSDLPKRVQFVRLTNSGLESTVPAPGPTAQSAPIALVALRACLGESPEWKQRRGFPLDVTRIEWLDEAASALPAGLHAWRFVPVDRLEQLFVALARVPGALHAFAARSLDWDLHAAEPCFELADGVWQDLYPELVDDPLPEAWRKAWMDWGQSRGLPVAELEAASLCREGTCLQARVAKRWMDRLRTSRTDVVKGENWLLAGTGALRACARLEIVAK